MTILYDVGDRIEGERVVCEYTRPRRLKPTRISELSGHREWRIKLRSAICIIEKKYRWLGD